ncbi:MAG TPA: iron-sulfur cluster assembly protein, partial [Thermodesulfobacteriota bacterium]|nr:iron-sulfur cluster assembly protein [Thermodesulfobacteriota bacterium]
MTQGLTVEAVREALRQVRYPGFTRDIVSFGLVKEVQVEGGRVRVVLATAARDPRIAQEIREGVERTLRGLPGASAVEVIMGPPAAPAAAAGAAPAGAA